jgi:hypothetical protein
MTVRKLMVAGALVLATALAGCGKVGRLEPAAPMFGHKAPGEAPPRQDPTRPVETIDPRDNATAAPPAPPPPAPPTAQP